MFKVSDKVVNIKGRWAGIVSFHRVVSLGLLVSGLRGAVYGKGSDGVFNLFYRRGNNGSKVRDFFLE